MLDYIRSQIKAQTNVNKKPSIKPIAESTNDEISNDVVLEYAKLFQELDDLTEEGTEEGKVRKLGIDIPFDDDIEVDNVEFNLNDGKVTDVPGDATVAESYTTMKTLDMFIQEAMECTPRMLRESDSMYNIRITNIANKLYEEYCIDAEKTGEFGFDKISVGDDRIPTKTVINFGPYNIDSDESDNFMTKVPVTFATDKDHKITKKQFDSYGFVKNGAFESIGKPLMQYMESNYVIPERSTLWDIVTPTGLYIPKGNGDSFCVVLEFMNEITNKKEYFGWTRSVRNDENANIDSSERINMESFVEESSWENHDGYLITSEQKARRERMKRPIGRFFQEAIDFGGGDATESDSSADTSDSGGGDDLPPASDSDNESSDSADSGDSGNDTSTDDTSSGEDDDKETAAVNDVSADIAKEVADRTQNDTADDTGVTFDDDDSSSGGIEAAAENDDNDSSLDDLDDGVGDDTDNSDMETDIDGDMNFENMSIDDLLERGSDKLKSMTLNEIKEFISSGDKDAIQEAFFLTKNNINKEVDVNIRKCLGILNDANMNVDKIFTRFKVSGRKLNRILSKAIKMDDVYNKDEKESIKKLNNALGGLLASLKVTQKDKNVPTIKQKITAFISEAKVVSVFVEDKLMGKTIQEGFVQEGFFLSASNVKKRLGKVIQPVMDDVTDIVDKANNGRLTRGTIVKMYKGKTGKIQSGGISSKDGYYGGYEQDHTIDTKNTRSLSELDSLLNKIEKKKKVSKAFNNNELNKLHELSETLSSYSDFIESIVFDNQASENTMKNFTSDAKKLLSLLNSVNDMIGGSNSSNSKTLTKSIENEEKKQSNDNQKGDE